MITTIRIAGWEVRGFFTLVPPSNGSWCGLFQGVHRLEEPPQGLLTDKGQVVQVGYLDVIVDRCKPARTNFYLAADIKETLGAVLELDDDPAAFRRGVKSKLSWIVRNWRQAVRGQLRELRKEVTDVGAADALTVALPFRAVLDDSGPGLCARGVDHDELQGRHLRFNERKETGADGLSRLNESVDAGLDSRIDALALRGRHVNAVALGRRPADQQAQGVVVGKANLSPDRTLGGVETVAPFIIEGGCSSPGLDRADRFEQRREIEDDGAIGLPKSVVVAAVNDLLAARSDGNRKLRDPVRIEREE